MLFVGFDIGGEFIHSLTQIEKLQPISKDITKVETKKKSQN
jgi:hypothetical protein